MMQTKGRTALLLVIIAGVFLIAGCGAEELPPLIQNSQIEVAAEQGEQLTEADLAGTVAARVDQAKANEEPDIDATVEAMVADELAALEAESAQQAAPRAESGSDAAPTSAATPRPAVDPNPELLLPFWDDFDQGLDPIWRVINGKPLVIEGWLTSADNELSLELGNTALRNYTIEFDIGGEDKTRCSKVGRVTLGFSPQLQYQFSAAMGHYKDAWYSFEDNDWEKIADSDDLDCGHFRIVVADNTYRVYVNGQMVEDMIFEPAEGPLLIRLAEEVYIDNFQISQ